MTERLRLDLALVKRGLVSSRQRAQSLIKDDKVLVNGFPARKSGTQVEPGDNLVIRGEDIAFVSRGGLKLEAAIKQFSIRVENKTCIDIGASTGGFTDCLLQHGASHVYAVDVGYGQLAWSLRTDPRVTVIERTNIRHMEKTAIPLPVQMAVIDVSFISLKIVVPAALQFLQPNSQILALIKPQFEVGKGKVGKGGVVRENSLHRKVIDQLKLYFNQLGLNVKGVIPSPILGPKGNREFVICMIT